MQNVAFLFCLVFLTVISKGQNVQERLNEKPYELLNIPNLTGKNISGQVVIAVIDDGFLLDHDLLKEFIWKNDKDIPNNGKDDDLNGFVDDVMGWDIADLDPNVVPSKEVIEEYYHGTMVASIIIQTFQKAYGSEAKNHLKIMPIKVLSDLADGPSMVQGYKGIDYAVANKADIICMAWNGGTLESENAPYIENAIKNEILLLASAGNESTSKIGMPAALESVFCVAAIDEDYKKTIQSNYGEKVDLVGFGSGIKSAHSIAQNAYFNGIGTSSSVSLICGALGLLKSVHPEERTFDLMSALKYTAEPIDLLNMRYLARLGTGVPNVKAALDYIVNESNRMDYYNPFRKEGVFYISDSDIEGNSEFEVNLPTGVQSFTLTPVLPSRISKKSMIEIVDFKNQEYSTQITNFPSQYRVKGNYSKVKVSNGKRKQFAFTYKTTPIDSISLYCKDIVEITDSSGYITDGSGDLPYANNASCKWHIMSNNDKNIALSFEKFELENENDQLLIFNGNNTQKDNLVARFTGDQIPPRIVANSTEILIWFITNSTVTKAGFKFHYQLVNEDPGVY